LLKSRPPTNFPIGGMMMSLTSEFTSTPKAAPMIRPTARSTMLPFRANSLNSCTRPIVLSGLKNVAKRISEMTRLLTHTGARARLAAGYLGSPLGIAPDAFLAVSSALRACAMLDCIVAGNCAFMPSSLTSACSARSSLFSLMY
jgi:hypothetical protein